MSQKGEKYARRMERRVDKLEQDVAAITTEQTTQGVRISAVEDDLAVYRAAVSARELKQAAAQVEAAKERRTARAAERERKARRRNKVLAFIALALFVAACVVMVAKAYSEEPAAEPAAPEVSAAILPAELLFTAAAEEEYMEDPQETEKIEEALLAQGMDGYGAARAKSILYEKGIPKELWDEALEDLPEMDGAIDTFLRRKLDGRTLDAKQIKKTVDALLRRGHSYHDIQAGLRRYEASLSLEQTQEDTWEDME